MDGGVVSVRSLIFLHFQLAGILPFTLNRNKCWDTVFLCLTVLCILILLVISIISGIYAEYIFFISDAVGTFTDVMGFVGPAFAHFVILFEVLARRNLHRSIWDRFKQIDLQLNRISTIVDAFNHNNFISFSKILLLVQIIAFGFEIRIMGWIGPNREWSFHWYCSIFSFVICRMQFLLFAFYVHVSMGKFNIINYELRQIKLNALTGLKSQTERRQMQQLYDRLKLLKDVYGTLWFNTELLCEAFGWSQLINMTSYFLSITNNLYWNYVAIYFGTNPFWKESLMCNGPPATTLIALFYVCEECLKQVNDLNVS